MELNGEKMIHWSGRGRHLHASGEENFWVIENKTLSSRMYVGNFTFRFNATADNNEDGWFDYVNITGYRFGSFNITASVGTEQVLINTTVNDTSADGGFNFNFNISNLTNGSILLFRLQAQSATIMQLILHYSG